MRHARTIGSILLDVELVTQEDIENALELQKQRGKRLGEVLVDLGVVSDDDIRWALAEQLNLPYVNIRKDQIDADIAKLLPEKLARRYHVIPILKIDGELTVVVDDPLNMTIIHDIERITKCDVKISLGRTSDILLAIDEIYGTSEEQIPNEQDIPPRFVSSWFHEEDIQKILNDPSGHVLMDRILTTALEHDVSRIYAQPGLDVCHVSFRVSGVLQEQIQLSKEWYSILLFRLKISADFEMSETQHPQYREFPYRASLYEGGTKSPVTLAVSILPTATGESAVLNVINKSITSIWLNEREKTCSPLQEQEFSEVRNLQTVLRHLKSGSVLLGGAPFLDKITTLYGMLNEFDPIRKKIVTLESHAEYHADKYYQIRYSRDEYVNIQRELSLARLTPLNSQVGSESNNVSQDTQSTLGMGNNTTRTYQTSHTQAVSNTLNPEQRVVSAWLSALKSHDADILLVDHIASDIVLSQCLDSAVHGLLFAALDFPNVFQILAYLSDCQVKPSIITSRVRALMAQHSVRILCPECKQKDTTAVGKQMLEKLPISVEKHPEDIYIPSGCPVCNMTGYAEHVVLFEVLQMESWLQELLMTGASTSEIREAAEERDFHSIEKKSLELLFSGQTSMEEVFSILT